MRLSEKIYPIKPRQGFGAFSECRGPGCRGLAGGPNDNPNIPTDTGETETPICPPCRHGNGENPFLIMGTATAIPLLFGLIFS